MCREKCLDETQLSVGFGSLKREYAGEASVRDKARSERPVTATDQSLQKGVQKIIREKSLYMVVNKGLRYSYFFVSLKYRPSLIFYLDGVKTFQLTLVSRLDLLSAK